MARPSKSVNVMNKHLTKEELSARKKNEEVLKGDSEKLLPPEWLNERQKQIFIFVQEEVAEAGILSNKDIFILAQGAVIIDRLEELEKLINNNIENLYDKNLLSARNAYIKDFFRYCNELCLSPQSRAKISNLIKDKGTVDPLLSLLNEEEETNDDS